MEGLITVFGFVLGFYVGLILGAIQENDIEK